MKNYIQKLNDLLKYYPKDIILYSPKDIKLLSKVCSKLPGSFNSQLFDFLKITNGASIMDYCFFGVQNQKLGSNFDKNVLDYWISHNHIAGLVIPFMCTSSSSCFGYLLKWNDNNKLPIVYFTKEPTETKLVGCCFEVFFETFLNDVKENLENGESIEINSDNWPLDIEHWLKSDLEIKEIVNHPLIIEVLNSR